YTHTLHAFLFFLFTPPSPTDIYTLSLHDALPISTFVIIAPLTLIDTFSTFLLVIFLVPIIYIVVKFARALQDEAEDVELLLLMGISLLNNLLWSVYKTSTNTLTFEYYPIDVLIALFLFALYWLRKYIRHTEKFEALTEELIEKDKSKDDFLAQT